MKDTIVLIGMIILGLALAAIIVGSLMASGSGKLNEGANAVNGFEIPAAP